MVYIIGVAESESRVCLNPSGEGEGHFQINFCLSNGTKFFSEKKKKKLKLLK